MDRADSSGGGTLDGKILILDQKYFTTSATYLFFFRAAQHPEARWRPFLRDKCGGLRCLQNLAPTRRSKFLEIDCTGEVYTTRWATSQCGSASE
jgi:hypothetical protein